MTAIDLRLGDWREVLADVESVDAIVTDTPYGERTHRGHDKIAAEGESIRDGTARQAISYAGWSPSDVYGFVMSWAPRCRGWFVAMTDHSLAPAWEQALSEAGRYVFAPLPFVATGSRVRMQGDGPSSWCVWIIVARPRNDEFLKWGTLPGAYILPKGHSDSDQHIGGKPLWLMRHLVRDYTRPGDLVCDPCAGGATTLIAAAEQGRRAIGAEIDAETHAKAMLRIKRGWTPDMFPDSAREVVG